MATNQLIQRCKNNNRKAQLELYNMYCDAMYVIAYRYIKDTAQAEDAMQEAFINAFTKLHQFTGEVTFGAWLKKIVINKCLDVLKAKKLELVSLNEAITAQDIEEHDWEVSTVLSIDQIKKAIQTLKEKYSIPLLLFLVEGYDHQEIAQILNITPVSSRTAVHRGKKKLQEILKSNLI